MLQTADIVSTRVGLAAGAREVNPINGSGSTARLLIAKGAASALTIYVVERTWKRNRAAAVLSMVVVNGLTAAVVVHNARVITR